MDEGVVGQAEHEIAHIVRRGGVELGEHRLDPSLVLVGRLGRCRGIPRDQSFLHGSIPLTVATTAEATDANGRASPGGAPTGIGTRSSAGTR